MKRCISQCVGPPLACSSLAVALSCAPLGEATASAEHWLQKPSQETLSEVNSFVVLKNVIARVHRLGKALMSELVAWVHFIVFLLCAIVQLFHRSLELFESLLPSWTYIWTSCNTSLQETQMQTENHCCIVTFLPETALFQRHIFSAAWLGCHTKWNK